MRRKEDDKYFMYFTSLFFLLYLYSYVNFESHCLLGSSQLSSQLLVRSVNSFPSYNFTLSCSWASGVTSSILVVLNQHASAREDTGWWNPSWNPNEEVIQLWAFSHFKDQVKSEIKNSKWLFQMEFGGKCSCGKLFSIQKRII